MNSISKYRKWMVCILAIIFVGYQNSYSQSSPGELKIEVTFNKTTSLVFPAVITSVDRGSRDLLAQKAKGVENILQLKAARHGFPQTNLTVITADGNIREFTIDYANEPTQKIIRLNPASSSFPASWREGDGDNRIIFKTALTESEMESCADQIINTKRITHFIRQFKHKIAVSLRGVYIKEDILFYHFRLSNKSNVNYDVDFIRFYVEDKQTVKRTASQEVNKAPVYQWGEIQKIKGQTTEDIVYAFPKFTIPDKKRFVIELFEENGGRHLKLLIKNKAMVNARLVP